MTHTVTPLGQTLATPGTGEPFSTAVVNSNLLLLENGVFADRVRLGVLENEAVVATADLNSLILFSAAAMQSRRIFVVAMKCDFQAQAGVWVQQGISRFPDKTTRDAEYAKASAAFRISGVIARITTDPVELRYDGANWAPASDALPITPTLSVTGAGSAVSVDVNGWIAFTAATRLNLDSAFTTRAMIHEIELIVDAATSARMTAKLRAAGADYSGATYDYVDLFANTSPAGVATGLAQTVWTLNAAVPSTQMHFKLKVIRAALASPTLFEIPEGIAFSTAGVIPLLSLAAGGERTAAARDGIGFALDNAAAFSGFARVRELY